MEFRFCRGLVTHQAGVSPFRLRDYEIIVAIRLDEPRSSCRARILREDGGGDKRGRFASGGVHLPAFHKAILPATPKMTVRNCLTACCWSRS